MIRWLAIVGNLLWGSLLLLLMLSARLSKDSITDSEGRIAYVAGVMALFSVVVLLWDPKREHPER